MKKTAFIYVRDSNEVEKIAFSKQIGENFYESIRFF